MIEAITSINNPLVKKIQSLQKKKYRDELGLFLVEGVRLVEEAVYSDWDMEYCLYTEAAGQTERTQAILATLSSKNCTVVQVTDSILAKICETEQPQGVAGVLRKRSCRLDGISSANANQLIAVLDEVQDPGNVGTVIRTADAAGCTAVILTKGCADIYAGKTVRSTMGSLFHLPVVEDVTTSELSEYAAKHGMNLWVTALDASGIYYQKDLRSPAAIVFGNEGRGVSSELLEYASGRLYIPIHGQAESLNVAVAAAVVLYEAVRQRA